MRAVLSKLAVGGSREGRVRVKALAEALDSAATVPLRVAEDAGAVAGLAADLAARCKPELRADAIAAAELTAAAAGAAARLVEVNLTAGPEDERVQHALTHARDPRIAADRAIGTHD